MQKRLIGVKVLAEYIGIKPGTLYQWVSERKIPYVKLGSRVKFDLKKINKWIDKKKIKPLKIWD